MTALEGKRIRRGLLEISRGEVDLKSVHGRVSSRSRKRRKIDVLCEANEEVENYTRA